jgi:pimeloyl-ACP methyl ester carboxylesterase
MGRDAAAILGKSQQNRSAQVVKLTEYKIQGVRVEAAMPTERRGERPPIIFVHGSCHGSWSWEKFLPHFAAAGWECHALNWYGHNGSDAPPGKAFVERGIPDMSEEIGHVASQFAVPPIIVAHSMGALASQKYAERNRVAALVLLASAVPQEVGGIDLDQPVDMNNPWGPPPLDHTVDMFFQGLTREEAEPYHALLCSESPKTIYEGTRSTVSVDRNRISGPILVVSGEIDFLTPSHTGRALADFYGADYRFVAGRGHNLLLEPKWQETADTILDWLQSCNAAAWSSAPGFISSGAR